MSPGGQKPRILVVEDNPADVGLIQLALKDAEFDCDLTVLDDGAEALALFRKEGGLEGGPVPDLAVLDLNLPKIGGLEVLEAIRANPLLDRMPVAILSSSSSPRDRARVEECGVDRFLTKPLDLDGFLRIGSILKSLLQAGRTSRSS